MKRADTLTAKHAPGDLGRGHRPRRGRCADDAGVVDERGDGTQFALGLGKQADHLRLVGAVGLNGERATPERANLPRDIVGRGAILPVADGDVVARGRGCQRGCPTDAAAAAGDDDDLTHAEHSSIELGLTRLSRRSSFAGCTKGLRARGPIAKRGIGL